MSSGRLFLDRGARQHCPSPLHRHPHPKTVPGWGTIENQRTANSVLTLCLSRGDNRNCLLGGYLWTVEGKIEIDPDQRVRQALRLSFSKMRELGSVRQVLLWFRRERMEVPMRIID
jgi:hypothetical protein